MRLVDRFDMGVKEEEKSYIWSLSQWLPSESIFCKGKAGARTDVLWSARKRSRILLGPGGTRCLRTCRCR